MQTSPILLTLVLVAVTLAGCHEPGSTDADSHDGTLKIAFTVKDDYDNPDLDPDNLRDWMASETGLDVELYAISSDGAAIEALRFGRADLAFLDGGAAWIAWKQYGLEAIAADQNSDGRTYYEAQAWVRADSGIADFDDLEGVTSCHTGWLKSAGMLMPMGYLIGNGHADVVGDPDDIDSLRDTIEAFFDAPVIPEGKGHPYLGYDGAFRCMTDGTGDVAFVKDTTWNDYCEGETARDWCLTRDAYATLPAFGQVPSHPVMVRSDLDDATRQAALDALLALNDSEEGRTILDNVLNTPGIKAVSTQEHLGSYSDVIQHVPGIASYVAAESGIA